MRAVAVVLLLSCAGAQDLPTVRVRQGLLRGNRNVSVHGVPFYSFRGIPFAQPPVGSLRFKAPKPAEPWEGVKNALNDSPMCVQALQKPTGQEDCLYLNVYTKKLGESEKMPVMVFIYGGGFIGGYAGSRWYGPDFLMRHDVVLVTFNYRLGVLGFLYLEDDTVPGNLGLRDQLLALQWIRENIGAFGGDADQVTLFGESAGAASVHYHLLTPHSQGYFSRAMMESGSALNPWSFNYNPRVTAFRMGQMMGYSGNSSQELVNHLMKADVYEMAARVGDCVLPEEKDRLFNFQFAPCAEVKGPDAFLAGRPDELMMQGKMRDLSLLAGVNSRECVFAPTRSKVFNDTRARMYVQDNIVKILAEDLQRIKSSAERTKVAASLKKFYAGDGPIFQNGFDDYIDIYSDMYFVEGVDCTISMLAANSANKHYYYVFSFSEEGYIEGYDGVVHGGEMPYIFLMNNKNMDPKTPEGKVSLQMTTFWTNFAKFGNPTPPSDVSNVAAWEAFAPNSGYYMDIGVQPSLKTFYEKNRLKFWKSLMMPCKENITSNNDDKLVSTGNDASAIRYPLSKQGLILLFLYLNVLVVI